MLATHGAGGASRAPFCKTLLPFGQGATVFGVCDSVRCVRATSCAFMCRPQETGYGPFHDVPMKQIAKSLFSKHGSLWARQSLRSHQFLQAKAKEHVAKRQAALREENEALESQRELLLSRIDVDEESGLGPLCMYAVALSDHDLAT